MQAPVTDPGDLERLAVDAKNVLQPGPALVRGDRAQPQESRNRRRAHPAQIWGRRGDPLAPEHFSRIAGLVANAPGPNRPAPPHPYGSLISVSADEFERAADSLDPLLRAAAYADDPARRVRRGPRASDRHRAVAGRGADSAVPDHLLALLRSGHQHRVGGSAVGRGARPPAGGPLLQARARSRPLLDVVSVLRRRRPGVRPAGGREGLDRGHPGAGAAWHHAPVAGAGTRSAARSVGVLGHLGAQPVRRVGRDDAGGGPDVLRAGLAHRG